MFTLLDRYILKNTIPPFLYGVLIFVTIFVVDIFMQLLDLAASRNLSYWVVTQLFLLKIPEILILTLPMGSLFGALMGFGQLDSNSEVTALKSGGISLFRQSYPVVIFTLFLAGLAFWINESLVPRCNQRFNKIFKLEVSLKNPIPNITRSEVFEIGNDQRFYVKEYRRDKKLMSGVTMITPSQGKFPRSITARQAQFMEGYCQFWDGRITFPTETGAEGRYILFEKLKYPIDTYKIDPMHLDKDQANKPNQMSFYQLQDYIEELKTKGVEPRYLIDYKVELYNKIALPLASLIFILIGIPLALGDKRSQKSGGAGLSIIIIFAYYILMSIGRALAKGGFVLPEVGAFLPNLLFLALGLFFIYLKRF